MQIVFEAGATNSNEFDTYKLDLVAIQTGAIFTSATLTIQVKDDAGNWITLKKDDGTDYQITATNSDLLALNPQYAYAVAGYSKARLVASAAQVGGSTLTGILRRL